ncbi:MAG TPA: hypothetical protein ENJ06_03835 [Phycisphaeraceae bacterium]|nr:hypothetical protein [Phycisphaeraceae bacterium]
MRNKSSCLNIFSFAILTLGLSGPLAADYENPPGWDGEPTFTHQTWDFNSDAIPLLADSIDYPAQNTFGDPLMVDVFLGDPSMMSWVDDPLTGGDRNGMWGGMTFNIDPNDPALGVTMVVPQGSPAASGGTEMWVQCAYWGSTSAGGRVLTVEIAHDENFQDMIQIYEAVASDIEDQSDTGSGSSGQYWRFTHTFTFDEQLDEVWVRISLIPDSSIAVFIDSVSIDTRRTSDCPADLDGDGFVGQSDLGILLAHYQIDGGGDVNGDGFTDQSDLGILLSVYQMPCQ